MTVSVVGPQHRFRFCVCERIVHENKAIVEADWAFRTEVSRADASERRSSQARNAHASEETVEKNRIQTLK